MPFQLQFWYVTRRPIEDQGSRTSAVRARRPRTMEGGYPNLYLMPKPPFGHSQAMLSYGQSMRQAPHSMQFS